MVMDTIIMMTKSAKDGHTITLLFGHEISLLFITENAKKRQNTFT